MPIEAYVCVVCRVMKVSFVNLQGHHSHPAGPHAKKDKPVSSEDFVAMVCERLMAVQKDRDQMRKRAQDHARKQGKSYDDIMVSETLTYH